MWLCSGIELECVYSTEVCGSILSCVKIFFWSTFSTTYHFLWSMTLTVAACGYLYTYDYCPHLWAPWYYWWWPWSTRVNWSHIIIKPVCNLVWQQYNQSLQWLVWLRANLCLLLQTVSQLQLIIATILGMLGPGSYQSAAADIANIERDLASVCE